MKAAPAPDRPSSRGILAALGAALLFGASTPLAKLLLGAASPWLLAGLLYLGSGIGLGAVLLLRRPASASIPAREKLALAGAVLAGGVIGPLLLMGGLSHMPAASASLLLNAESVFTALIAWFVFRENFDRRIALGMALIVAGAVVLSGFSPVASAAPGLAVLGACLAWAIDNNLTRKVSLADPRIVAMTKGLAAGAANTALALAAGASLPSLPVIGGALLVGWLGYGVSLALFVVALRELGTARTGAYFATAPFAGAALAVLLGETVTVSLLTAGLLMAAGVWLHVTERHAHRHTHLPLEHSHEHEHDEHHRHEHQPAVPPGTRHTHAHRHDRLTHEHAHYPDAHHRHRHSH
jgi:drug/metabolite transporter (DMT)-like permease